MNKRFKREIPNIIIFFFVVLQSGAMLSGWSKSSTKITINAQDNIVATPTPQPTLQATTVSQEPLLKCDQAIDTFFLGDKEMAKKVSFCESSLNTNSQHKLSSAKGCFQILEGTWKQFKCEGDPLNAVDNVICANKIYDYYGSWGTRGGWRASRACWSK